MGALTASDRLVGRVKVFVVHVTARAEFDEKHEEGQTHRTESSGWTLGMCRDHALLAFLSRRWGPGLLRVLTKHTQHVTTTTTC